MIQKGSVQNRFGRLNPISRSPPAAHEHQNQRGDRARKHREDAFRVLAGVEEA